MRTTGVRWLTACAIAVIVGCSQAPSQPPSQPTPSDARERAYRANNVGVALLEQLKFPEAAAAFRDALGIEPSLGIAQFNLSLALFYAQDFDGAQKASEDAARLLPQAPQPPYVLGLIARAQGRTDAARAQFDRVRQMDPRDVGVNINMAQIALEDQRYADAIAALRPVVAEESSNVTAAYVLGLALTRSGDLDEGQRLLARSQALRNSGYAMTLGPGYSEQGRYAEGIASTGVEPDLVEPVSSQVAFAATPLGPRGWVGGARGLDPSLALLDFDADGDLDALVVEHASARLLRNDGDAWTDATAGSSLDRDLGGAAVVGVVAADYDNDGAADLLLLRPGRSSLFRNDGRGHFTDVTGRASLPSFPYVPGAGAFADVDHDGDLDILIAGVTSVDAARTVSAGVRSPSVDATPAPVQLLRNNRDGTFTDITRASHIDRSGHGVAIVPTDYDNRRDVDLLLVSRHSAPALFANQRDGSFRDVAGSTGLDAALTGGAEVAAASSGDVNKDDAPDFVFATSRGLVAAVSDGRGRFSRQVIGEGAEALHAVQLTDYDNDGLLDAVAWGADGPRLWRNEGRTWRDVTESVFAARLSAEATTLRSASAWSVADVNRDGWPDLVTVGSDGLWLWRNSGDRNRRSLRVELSGLVSNKPGIGSKVQVRAGSLSSRIEVAATSPAVTPADIVFGLGRRPGGDVVRVLWPSGILQAEVAEPPAGSVAVLSSPFRVAELDRKPSSCPFLFVWNGERFEFVTDFLGAGEMGAWQAPGVRNRPDPVEYVRIRGDQLRPRNGRFELRVTNELEETLFLDELQLVAVAHPEPLSIFPNEGMTDPPKPHRMHAVDRLRPPNRVTDEHDHDVTERVHTLDWTAPDDFTLRPIRGYAAPHSLTIDVGPERDPMLVLTGWTDYAFSSDNVAAHQAGLTSEPPVLEARTPDGKWRPLAVSVGFPVGRPQSIAVPLAGVLRPGERHIRLSTNMRVYWDQILVGSAANAKVLETTTLTPAAARLSARGFSAEVRPHANRPPVYDHSRVALTSPWKAMAGAFTREGDVEPLLAESDDRFVIARSGDEIAVAFDADALPPLPAGWTRTFLLRADGFSKEMDINSASPDAVQPLPFHRMSGYPYPSHEHYPDTVAHEDYRRRFNTRQVVKPWLPLHASTQTMERPRPD
ncbi:MAG: tetratricopeptide repeat protein [Acidimicrobiia bacterium]|nr:tetratricopeptide repeat protein [Acidimicrobiia bacterium]